MFPETNRKQQCVGDFNESLKRSQKVPTDQVGVIAQMPLLYRLGRSYFLIMLNAYPLNQAKIKVLKSGSRQASGILVEHLFRCARKIGVPQVYINDAQTSKKRRDFVRSLLKNQATNSTHRGKLVEREKLLSARLRIKLSNLAEATAMMIRNREQRYEALMRVEEELNL